MRIYVAGEGYGKEESEGLREAVIRLRDTALNLPEPNFNAAIILSHTIAWMAGAIEALALDEPRFRRPAGASINPAEKPLSSPE